jgi:hypothetical protein
MSAVFCRRLQREVHFIATQCKVMNGKAAMEAAKTLEALRLAMDRVITEADGKRGLSQNLEALLLSDFSSVMDEEIGTLQKLRAFCPTLEALSESSRLPTQQIGKARR